MGSIIAHKGFLWEAEYDLEGTWNGSEAILEEPYAGSPFWTVLRNPVMGVVTIS
jgi:hypothetical protein